MLIFSMVASVVTAGNFELTNSGVIYVVRDSQGNVVSQVKPQFDAASGNYVVKDENNQVVVQQPLPAEAAMEQIKIVAPLKGTSHSYKATDFLGNSVPVLRELPANDARYQDLKNYIDNDPGLKRTVAMQLQARNMKLEQLQQQLSQGGRDPALVTWLANDLKKPIYLEVGDSGSIYHDPKGFIMAEKGADGQITYRDNGHVNRLVIPPNSEAFQGGMNDSSAASVMAHEVGHMIMDQLYERQNYPKTTYAGAHSKNSVTDEGFAISEGWAEAVETLANKERLNSGDSWRLQSQKNIADNKYVFKNQGVVDGPNDGILKNGGQMLSTEGVNATMFYKMLTDYSIQAPYEKVCKVFEQSKPQTYRDFVKEYVQMFPEDRSHVVKQFLETTKYATVDSSAAQRYKAVHDAQQAFQSASDPSVKAQLESDYRAKLDDYNQWKDQLYKQTVVDGQLDRAVGDTASVAAFSDSTNDQYRKIKLSEVVLKSQKALGKGVDKAVSSIKESFSVKNVAITAGTAIATNLVQQMFSGEKVSFKKAFSAVASLQFVGNVVGSTMGSAAGHVVAPLIQAFVPIPVVGALAGALLPTLGAIAGGQLGGNLGAGVALKQALKNLDPVAITGQAIGSTLGAMLGAMIPIPVLGPMIGGMLGGILGEKIFSGIAKWFGYKKDKQTTPEVISVPGTVSTTAPVTQTQSRSTPAAEKLTMPTPVADPYGIRLSASSERTPFEKMHPSLRAAKDEYERAYQSYVAAVSIGNQTLSKERQPVFLAAKQRYEQALRTYQK
jgi:hypothetical protein